MKALRWCSSWTRGWQRCQQMFADLNRYAIRPSRSLECALRSPRRHCPFALISWSLKLPVFPELKALVELETASLSLQARRRCSLSARYPQPRQPWLPGFLPLR